MKKTNVLITGLFILLAFTLIRGLLYTFLVPPWQHSDEPTHFEHVRYIIDTGKVPVWGEVNLALRKEIAQSMLAYDFWKGIDQPALDDKSLSVRGNSAIGIPTFGHPKLYYLVASLWLRPWMGLSTEGQLFALRILGVLFHLAIVFITWLAARRIFEDRVGLVLGTTGFAVFLPMLSDTMASCNNDVLVNLISAIFFFVLVQIFARGFNLWRGILLVGLLALAMLTKTTAISLGAALVLAPLFYPWKKKSIRWVYLGILIIGGLCLLGGTYWLVKNAGQSAVADQVIGMIEKYFRIHFVDTLRGLRNGVNPAGLQKVSITVFASFWAIFGWRHVLLPGWAYKVLLGIFGLDLLGLIAWGALRLKKMGRSGGIVLVSIFTAAATWAIAILRSQAVQGVTGYESHGRYIAVAIIPCALAFSLGALGWVPEKWEKVASWIYLAAFFLFDALAFWGVLVPYYHG